MTVAAVATIAAIDHAWGYVTAGYLIVGGTLAAYTARLLVRGRRLSRQVRPEDRRWL
jgi:hypothetical protein